MQKNKVAALTLSATLFMPAAKAEHEFTWTNMFLASASLSNNFDYEQYSESYMRIYRRDVWDKFHEDEFAFRDKKKETVDIMKDRFNAFDTKEPFVIRTTFEFSEYNFDKNEFPLEGMEPGAYFPISREGYTYDLPEPIELHIKNPGMIGNIEMPAEKARAFIKDRKSSTGNVNREVIVEILIQAKEQKGSLDKIKGEIIEATVFADKKMTKEIQKF